MRTLFLGVLALAFALVGCDASDPAPFSADAQAKSHPYQLVGPSSVRVGDCDTFVIRDHYGNAQTGHNWSVSGGGYLVASGLTSAFVGATAPPRYTLSARVNSPSGPYVSKTVSVAPNPDNTYEC